MSDSTDFLDGVIAKLVADGRGVWRTGSKYLATETGITDASMPDDPDKMLALTTYLAGGGSDRLPIDRFGLQLRVRGDTSRRTALAMRDACKVSLDGLAGLAWGAISLNRMWAISSPPMGRDAAGRWIEAVHFYANVNVAATANRKF